MRVAKVGEVEGEEGGRKEGGGGVVVVVVGLYKCEDGL